MKKDQISDSLYKNRKMELLSPAGSYEAFEAALGAGADAVYAGGTRFGARACAVNFQDEELLRAIRVSHIHGKKFYLTVNTLLKDQELEEELVPWLTPFYEEGLDAVIIQDMGVLRVIRRCFPGLPLHASTQMTVTGPEGMRFLEKNGVSRVVPARELSLEEIFALHKASPIEIEIFIHGALCYSFSGQCLMSSILGGRSGNRGRCAQPCRLPYQMEDPHGGFREKKDFCPLSMKDLCAIELLPEILAAGAVSLKIEGRMKSPQYTAGVTAIYRKYLDLLLKEDPRSYKVSPEDKKELLEVFSRGGSCSGYFHTHNGAEMMAFFNSKKTGGVSVLPVKRKEKISGTLTLALGKPALLEARCRGKKAFCSMGMVEAAQSQPVSKERVRLQMERLGNTEFAWENLDIQMDEGIFVPVKTLNELRRKALEDLEETLISPEKKGRKVCAAPERSLPRQDAPAAVPLYVSCETYSQAEIAANTRGIQGLYLPFDILDAFLKEGRGGGKEMYLSLPHIHRGTPPKEYFPQAAKWLEQGMSGFLVRTLESYALLQRAGLGRFCVLDASLYTWNKEACAFWREQGILRNTVPLELNEKELRSRDNRSSELLIYGYLPLMVSAQCVRKNTGACRPGKGRIRLKDRYHKLFSDVCFCHPWKEKTTERKEKCYNIIYNTVPLGLLKEKEQIRSLGVSSLRMSFTIENARETETILKEFLNVYGSGEPGAESGFVSGRELTRGHFKRGVM